MSSDSGFLFSVLFLADVVVCGFLVHEAHTDLSVAPVKWLPVKWLCNSYSGYLRLRTKQNMKIKGPTGLCLSQSSWLRHHTKRQGL